LTIDSIFTEINFSYPTPDNGSITTNNSIFVNVSTNDTNDHSAFIDWNNSLVLWMNFETVLSNGTVYDNSTHSNNGVMYNFASNTTSNGKRGSALDFDGVNDFVDLRDTMDGMTHLKGTISAWIKANSIPASYNFIYHNHNDSAWADRIYFGLGNTTQIFLWLGESNITYISNISLNQWYHLTLSWEGGVNGTWTVYKDGVNVSTDNYIGLDIFSNKSKIGALQDHNNGQYISHFNGLIDEFMIFNRVLSSQEVKALYNAKTNNLYNNFTNKEL
jgi:hypothetical protein